MYKKKRDRGTLKREAIKAKRINKEKGTGGEREMSREEINETGKGNLVLVNADHGYKGGEKEMVKLPRTEVFLKEEAAKALLSLLSTLPEGEIVPVSGYRSFEEQTEIFEDSVKESGMEFTKKYVAKPGCSEHQTGLAIDLGQKAEVIDFIRPAFPYEGICQTFRERAADYGFIERYEREKEEITGIGAEQWHFRYVGRPHSWIIREKGFALEEYIAYIRQFDDYKNPLHFRYFGNEYEIYFQYAEEGKAFPAKVNNGKPGTDAENGHSAASEGWRITISGNNADGWIITKERPEE